MSVRPNRLLGALIGGGWLALSLAAILLSLDQLGQALISPGSLLWMGLLLLSLPLALLVGFRLFELLSASYRIDRDGLYVRWGLIYEQIPIGAVTSIQAARAAGVSELPAPGLWWPGCLVGQRRTEQGQKLVYFAGSGPRAVVKTRIGRWLVLAPPDLSAFESAFVAATRMGALEQIPERSERPDFLFTRIWNDRMARGLVLAGLALPLLGLGFLVLRAPGMPAEVPFGFGPAGEPGPPAPPGRLLLLPLIAGLAWLVDLVLASWFYRSPAQRPLAYALWGSAVVSGALLDGAALLLTSIVGR